MTKIISGIKMISPILIVCTSCKTSYNVLSHAHIYRGWGGVVGLIKFPEVGGGGVVEKRGSPDLSSPEVGVSVRIEDHLAQISISFVLFLIRGCCDH